MVATDFPKGQGYLELAKSKDSCMTLKSDQLAPLQSCVISGVFVPTQDGAVSLGASLSYQQPYNTNKTIVNAETEANVSSFAVTGKVSKKLPAYSEVRERTPVSFTFENPNDHLSATDLSFHVFPDDGRLIAIKNSCAGKTVLGPKQTCTITGTLAPSEDGPINVGVSLSYRHPGSKAIVTLKEDTTTDVSTLAVKARVNLGLTSYTAMKASVPVSITFQNTNQHLTAKNISVIPLYSHLTDVSDGCASIRSLTPGQTCTITGKFQASTVGLADVGATLSYDHPGGSGRIDVSKILSTDVSDFAITGSVDKALLPEHTEVGKSYPISISFENTSQRFRAQHVSTDLQFPRGSMTHVVNHCDGKDLLAQTTCTITGDFTPTSDTAYVIGASLTYDHPGHHQRDKVSVTRTTQASTFNVVGAEETNKALPTNVVVGKPYPVAVRFTNTNRYFVADHVSNAMILPKNGRVEGISDGCKAVKALKPGAFCVISATYTPLAQGVTTFGATLSYQKQGEDVTRSETHEMTANVATVSVTGKIDAPLTAKRGTKPEVNIIFTNNSRRYSAEDVHVDTSGLPTAFHMVSNGCKNTRYLDPKASCTIQGYLVTDRSGNIAMKASLNYNEGQPVVVEKTTAVTLGKVAYFVNQVFKKGDFQGNIQKCSIDDRGQLSDCKLEKSDLIYPSALAFNADETKVYIADVWGSKPTIPRPPVMVTGTVRTCRVNNAGDFVDCKQAEDIGWLTQNPNSFVLNDAQDKLYIGGLNNYTDYGPDNVMVCGVSSDKAPCDDAYVNPVSALQAVQSDQMVGIDGQDDLLTSTSLAFNWANNEAYVVDAKRGQVNACSINDDGKLDHCFTRIHGLHAPGSLTFDAKNKFAYVTEYSGAKILKCDLKADGAVSSVCQSATVNGEPGITSPFKVKVNGDNAIIFRLNNPLHCVMGAGGNFDQCVDMIPAHYRSSIGRVRDLHIAFGNNNVW